MKKYKTNLEKPFICKNHGILEKKEIYIYTKKNGREIQRNFRLCRSKKDIEKSREYHDGAHQCRKHYSDTNKRDNFFQFFTNKGNLKKICNQCLHENVNHFCIYHGVLAENEIKIDSSEYKRCALCFKRKATKQTYSRKIKKLRGKLIAGEKSGFPDFKQPNIKKLR